MSKEQFRTISARQRILRTRSSKHLFLSLRVLPTCSTAVSHLKALSQHLFPLLGEARAKQGPHGKAGSQ